MSKETNMIKKLLRRLFKLKKYHVSDVDKMLDKRHRDTIASDSQQAEIDKYKAIFAKRDQSAES